MDSLFDIIGIPFEYIMKFLDFTHIYPITIIIFTLIVNVAMIPLTVKQQKSMAKQARLKPKLDALQKKYGNDRNKMAMAQQELYQNENISPTGGCLPMVIRMIVLMGVYRAVYRIVAEKSMSFMFFGLDLSKTPSVKNGFEPLWLIPILVFVSQALSMLVSQLQQKKAGQVQQGGGCMMIGMMLFMPAFSAYITFNLQAAVGYYWIISSIVNTLIQLYVNHHFSAQKMMAIDTAKQGLERKKYEAARIRK